MPRSSSSRAITTSCKRTPDGWKISKRMMELLWGESKADEGYPGRPRWSRSQGLGRD